MLEPPSRTVVNNGACDLAPLPYARTIANVEARAPAVGRRGIEGDPAQRAEVHLDPGVRIGLAHGVVVPEVVVVRAVVAVDDAGGDVDLAEQHGQCRRVVLAVPRSRLEEETFEGVGAGPLAFGQKDETVFLGRELQQHKDYSEATAVTIDQEVRGLVETAYQLALTLLRENIDQLHQLAQALLDREILDGSEISTILNGGELDPPSPPHDDTPTDPEPFTKPSSLDDPDEAPGHTGGEPSPSPA